VVPQLARSRRRRALEKPLALLGRQPVPETNADPPHPRHATNTGCQFGTQEAGVGRLVRDAPAGSEPKIDRGRLADSFIDRPFRRRLSRRLGWPFTVSPQSCIIRSGHQRYS